MEDLYRQRGRSNLKEVFSDDGADQAFAGQYAESMAQSTGMTVCIADRDQVIAVAGGPKKELLQKTISSQLEEAVNERETFLAGIGGRAMIPVADEDLEGITAQAIAPIICEGDAIGAVILMSREPRVKFGDAELRLVTTAAGFLGLPDGSVGSGNEHRCVGLLFLLF